MSKTILLADDSVTIHKVVELTFLDEDYAVEAVRNGDEALAWLEQAKPDLVIADVHMPPGPTGYDVCERVREMHPGVPVLLLAGTFEPFDAERAAAADAHLRKPFDSQTLLETVQELMGEAGGAEADAGDTEAAASEAASEAPAAAAEAATPPAAAGDAGGTTELSQASLDAIARRVVELLGDQVVREVAWEVVPDLAEVVVKERLRELEEQVD